LIALTGGGNLLTGWNDNKEGADQQCRGEDGFIHPLKTILVSGLRTCLDIATYLVIASRLSHATIEFRNCQFRGVQTYLDMVFQWSGGEAEQIAAWESLVFEVKGTYVLPLQALGYERRSLTKLAKGQSVGFEYLASRDHCEYLGAALAVPLTRLEADEVNKAVSRMDIVQIRRFCVFVGRITEK
jgi:hypothetical protein